MNTTLINFIENELNREDTLLLLSYLNNPTTPSPKLWRAASLLYTYLQTCCWSPGIETERIGMFDVQFLDGKLANYRPSPDIILPSKLTVYYSGVLMKKSIPVFLSMVENTSQREEALVRNGLEKYIKDLPQLKNIKKGEWLSCITIDGTQYIFRRMDE